MCVAIRMLNRYMSILAWTFDEGLKEEAEFFSIDVTRNIYSYVYRYLYNEEMVFYVVFVIRKTDGFLMTKSALWNGAVRPIRRLRRSSPSIAFWSFLYQELLVESCVCKQITPNSICAWKCLTMGFSASSVTVCTHTSMSCNHINMIRTRSVIWLESSKLFETSRS